MVYRYESDGDSYEEFGDHDAGPSAFEGSPTSPPAGPSPGRFPTPSLPRGGRPPAPVSPAPYAASIPLPPRPVRPVEPRFPPARGGSPKRKSGGRRWRFAVGGTALVMLLALCGLGTTALVTDGSFDAFDAFDAVDDRLGSQTDPAVVPTTAPTTRVSRSLDSRLDDPVPLTATEVFPNGDLVVSDGKLAYQVLKTHSGASCAVAASGEVADLIDRLGCSQVVRATLRAPDGVHLATAGLFNLTDRASAERARERIKPMLDERRGRFRGMAVGEGTETVARSAARVGWQIRGHYLAYGVVARIDGEVIPAEDEKAREILYDLIELHLSRKVLENRATGRSVVPSRSPAASRSASPADDAPETPSGRRSDRPSTDPDQSPDDE